MSSDIFRQEALEYHAQSRLDEAPLLLPPRWTQWSYRLLIALVLLLGAGVAFGTVPQHADAPATIQVDDTRVAIRTTHAGVVQDVSRTPGSRIEPGQAIVRLHSDDTEPGRTRLDSAFESALSGLLANPRDENARRTVRTLRAERVRLTAASNDSVVYSPVGGTVDEVAAGRGHRVEAGDILAWISVDAPRVSVLGLFPARYRPSLREGQAIRLEVAAYPLSYRDLTIDRIDSDILGAIEAARVFGDAANSDPAAGPFVVIRAVLSAQLVQVDRDNLHYVNGMRGTVRARLGRERLLSLLAPRVTVMLGWKR